MGSALCRSRSRVPHVPRRIRSLIHLLAPQVRSRKLTVRQYLGRIRRAVRELQEAGR